MLAGQIAQIVAFVVLAFIAVAGAVGVTTTMSMFRSGIFLMASFVGVAGLFILLAADLMALLQIMMYIGGMLVMILFMVLFMQDPGGAMMAAMPDMMAPVERFFSRGLEQDENGGDEENADSDPTGCGHGGHEKDARPDPPDRPVDASHGDRQSAPGETQEMNGAHDSGGHMDDMDDMDDMSDMSMVTPVRKSVAWVAAVCAVLLIGLLVVRSPWIASAARPDPDSARAVGNLLMGKYMIGFEGAGFLILLGIVGSVLLAHTERISPAPGRDARIAVAQAPVGIESDVPVPLAAPGTAGGDRHAVSAANSCRAGGEGKICRANPGAMAETS